ncbi:hypothetical protein pb186bvf_008818 [Paramecium bursaria]
MSYANNESSGGFDDMIGANRQYLNFFIEQFRNYYVALSNERGKPENNNNLMSSTATVNNMINENKQFYKPAQIEEQQEEEEEKVDQNLPFYILALSKTSIPQIQYIGLLYNSNTILDKSCEQIEDAKILDEVRRKRRQIKLVGSSNHEEQPKQESVKKKYKRLYKNYIAKLSFNIPDNLKLVSKDLDANKSWTKILKLQDFGNKCPSLSIAQEKVTGRFYIYDNSCGKVHIYSSEILINSNKDRPLVSLSLNEEIPRQNPILYLVECEHEFQWKSVLFVIGGFHKQKSKKVRPLRSIKVFEIKRREVTLTPAITINMQYPRMSPIVFDLAKDQGLLWQQADTKLLGSKNIDSRYIFFMGGNPLLEFEKEVDPQLKAANQTTEYIQIKKVLDHINRASQFTTHDQYEIQGINFSKLEIVDTLNIKYQNNPISEKIYNHLHHAAIAKINDDVLESKYHVIIGGDRSEAIQLQSIQQQFNEINFIGSKYQLQRPTKIWSANNIGQFNELYYYDESYDSEPIILQNMDSRRRTSGKQSCTCSIQ